jgi:transcriptional regulator with XRE-family HTH domain
MAAQRFPSQVRRARDFGRRVSELRQERRWTLKELSDRTTISVSQLSRIAKGGSGPPPDELIKQLAKAFEVDLRRLMHVAGRAVDPKAFEEMALDRIEQLMAAQEELAKDQRERFDRIDAALASLTPD